MNNNALKEAQFAAKKGDVGAFVRGYFLVLESWGIQAAALHAWETGFEGDLSDVDYVLSEQGFERLIQDLTQYADSCDWRLCQVLRHESTAAFCVCSWKEEPSRVVALDACSDYRRRERVLIGVDELLADRKPLEWGGYRLAGSTELRYRFIKGAIKQKKAEDMVDEFSAYPVAARLAVEQWLRSQWDINLEGWQAQDIEKAWKALDPRTLEAVVVGKTAALRRVFWRVTRPTGLVVVNANAEQDAAISAAFGRLYFRRNVAVGSFHFDGVKQLMESTLVRSCRLGLFWKMLLGRDLWIEASEGERPEALVNRMAKQLRQRCLSREGGT